MRVALLLALGCCLALAGCSFAAAPPTPHETLTPAPVGADATPSGAMPTAAPGPTTPFRRTATRTPEAVPYLLPDGYEPTGLDPQAATAGHRAALANRSAYRLTVTTLVDDERRRAFESRRLVDGERRLVERRRDGDLDLAVYEANGTVYGYRPEGGDSTQFRLHSQYVTVDGPVVGRQAYDLRSALRYDVDYASTVLFAGEWGAVTTQDAGEETFVSYRSTRPSDSTADPSRLSRFGGRVVVDQRGLVRFAGLRADLLTEDGIVERRLSARLDQLGTAEVDPPAWLDAVAHAEATVRDGYVVVRNTGGRAIPLSTAEVETPDGSYGTTLNGTLDPGERLYVSARPDTDGYRFARTPPEAESYAPTNGSLTVTLGDESVAVVLGVEGSGEDE